MIDHKHFIFHLLSTRWIWFAISGMVIIPGLISLIVVGLKPAVDFTGGSLIEIETTGAQLTPEVLAAQLPAEISLSSVVSSGQNRFTVRTSQLDQPQHDQLLADLNESAGGYTSLQFATVGPTLGRELLIKTLIAIGLVAVGILSYIWWKFSEWSYGVAATLAMMHDSLVLLGAFSLLGYWLGVEVDVLFVTALLTTLSFSVHDTIVVFDRIREKRRHHSGSSLITLANAAVVETLSRSLNNSITIIITLSCLVLLGGDTIRWFAVALLIGAITGTYSSTFTAVPLLIELDLFRHRRLRLKKLSS